MVELMLGRFILLFDVSLSCLKGLADYYDKHKPVTQEEQVDAIDTYSKLLTFVER